MKGRRTSLKLRPLDLVVTPNGAIAIVTEVGEDGEASINYCITQPSPLKGSAWGDYKTAWWDPKELKILDSIPARQQFDAFSRLFSKDK